MFPKKMLFLLDSSTVIRGAPQLVTSSFKLVTSTLMLLTGAHSFVSSSPRLDACAPRCSPGRHQTSDGIPYFCQRSLVNLMATASVQSTLGFGHSVILVRQLPNTPSGSQ